MNDALSMEKKVRCRDGGQELTTARSGAEQQSR